MKLIYLHSYYKKLLFAFIGLSLLFLVGYEVSILRSIWRVPSMAKWHSYADDDDESTCHPKNNFLFAKTHKTGSSTIQNILMRRVFETNMSMVFPLRNTWMFTYDGRFTASENTVKGYSEYNSTFDAFLFHSRWNYQEVRRIVPHGPAFTILRDPISVFESGYSYFGWRPIKNISAYVGTHINYLWPERSEGQGRLFGKNQNLWDFGMESDEMEIPRLVNQKIDELSQQFDLVMIAERMDESLVLLQELLCWPIETMTYLNQNQRKSKERNQMSEETRMVLEKWLWADYMLYDHFRSVLNRKITEYETRSPPHQLQNRVSRLRSTNRDLKRRCVANQTDNAGGLEGAFKVALPMIMGYKVKKENIDHCKLYAVTEPFFTKLLRARQFPNETEYVPPPRTKKPAAPPLRI